MNTRPYSADVRVLPACAIIDTRKGRFTYHRISEAGKGLPHFRVQA